MLLTTHSATVNLDLRDCNTKTPFYSPGADLILCPLHGLSPAATVDTLMTPTATDARKYSSAARATDSLTMTARPSPTA